MKKIAVYGTLRQGHGNHRYLLSDSKKLTTEIINIPFEMISLGGFPGLIPSEEKNDIVVEVYEVSSDTYRNVEQLEGFPRFYQKAIVPTSQGDNEIYVLESERYQNGFTKVESGDWNNHTLPRY